MVEMAKIHCFSALLVRKKKKKTTATTTTTKDSPKVVENAKNGILQLRLESLVHPSDDIRAKEATLDATIPAHDSKIIGDDQLDGMDGAYEGGDEHDDAPSMRRDFSDFDLQAKAAAEQGEDAGANGGSLDEKPEGGGAAAEVAILSGHISDPGFGQKSDLSGSPWLKRSCSNIETRAAAACLPPLSPSKSLSYEDLQALLGNGNGGVPHEFNGSPLSVITACSADRVILKKKSSSQVLPSRSRKLWWRLFLWSHRNLHSSWNYSAQQRVPAPYDGFNSRKGGYSSDTLEPGHGNEGQDAAAGCGRSQWMAFSMDSSSSPLDRVNAWVNSLEDNPCSSVDFDAAETPAFPDSPEAGEQARKNSQQHQSGRRQAEELFRANHVIQSLNPLSTVAHISGMGLQVVPTISPFTSLRAVNLSGNSIAHISPGALPKSLHALDLSRNRITAIEGLRDLTRLRVLNLSYNKISRIGHGLSNCILIKELYLAGNKISNVEGLHRLLKLAVLDLSFNKLTTAKALGQLVANYNSLLVLNLLGNPVQSNVGDDQLRKVVAGLLPQLTYLNKQPIKPQRAREGAADTIAKAALGHNTAWRRPTRRASQGAAAATAASSANRGRPVGGASAGHGTARRRRKPKLPTSAGRR